jgi:hypothetical protein
VLYEKESESRPLGDTPNAEKVWKLYARYGNVATVAEKIHMSQGRVLQLIDARSQALLDACSPENKARALTLLLDRWGELYQMAMEDKLACEPGSNGSNACMAIMAKCNIEVAKLFGLGQQLDTSAVGGVVRTYEVIERLRTVGIHSKAAKEIGDGQAKRAGIDLEVVQEVPVEAQGAAQTVVDACKGNGTSLTLASV